MVILFIIMSNTTPPHNNQQSHDTWYTNPLMLIFVIGLPAFVVIACIFFVFYSIKIQDATVRDDWYMDGKTLYQDASRDQLAYDLGVSGVMRLNKSGDSTQVVFELNYPKESLASGKLSDGTPLNYPKTLSVSISHATDKSKDRDFVITHQAANRYTGEVVLDATPAKYYLQVSNAGTHNWRLLQPENLPKNNIVFLPLTSFNATQNDLPDQRDKRPSSATSQNAGK
ncbi:Uncharacterized protein conserved in bacteria [Moraxella cuniculi]|uniref:Uncharacterized protein conserved in bacteria n=2 Tax=Moraxella cuniculi TaxID=34061 RepID=A0A3S4QPI1_9GAMM|nr:Uncharacterized protein conserved in bacteria [Moraxella cuniculi]